MSPDPHPQTPVSFVIQSMSRGLRGRCPRCGRGKLFAGGIKLHETCARCGHLHEFHPGNWSGAVMISQTLMGLMAIPVWIALSVLTRLDFTYSVSWTVVIVLAFWLASYRNVKGLWYGWLYAANRAPESAD